ncbi:HCP-like protein [Hysterangium stoloniferum]|nr:HCP-like protein [Hysterangium stoloniferum]
MSYAPPTVPPLPQSFHNQPRRQNSNPAPPIPPLPPNFQPEKQHPMLAPMPERAMPSLPADMARTLDESAGSNPGYPGGFARPQSQAGYSGPPPPQSHTPIPQPHVQNPGGFLPSQSQRSSYASLPPPNGSGFVYGSQPPQSQVYGLPNAMENMSLNSAPTYPPRSSSVQPSPHPNPYGAAPGPAPSSLPPSQIPPSGPNRTSPLPELTAPMPTLESLAAAQASFPLNSPPPLPWIRDVLFIVDRLHPPSDAATGPSTHISDPVLRTLLHSAATGLLSILSPTASPHPPEALYLRGLLHASGSCSEIFPKTPREAFKDFEASARSGWHKAWFRLGRDYEGVGDLARARDCFERGVKAGVESCCYRMGMALLLGQLGLPVSQAEALPLLQRAAQLATIETPQPAYVYGLILLGEFAQVAVEPGVIAGLIPRGSTLLLEARKYVERSAYFGFGAAQYKLGHAYEYAVEPFPSDPLLSVQYYSLASQQGEPEADMALSKWFLCGAEGAFEKDEVLAVTFADKAARKGLGSAEFALGYYAEVGIGGPKDVDAARRWYAKSIEHGNTDAPARLNALSLPSPQSLSRTEHDKITDDKLIRRRTQARMDAVKQGRVAVPAGAGAGAAGSGDVVVGRIAAQAGAGPGYSNAPGQPQPPAQTQAPPPLASYQQQPQQQQLPSRQQQQPQGAPYPPLNASPKARPRPPLEHAPATATRYSLVDSPSPAGTPPPSTGTAAPSGLQGGRAQGRPPNRRHPSQARQPPQPPRQHSSGPATFAEMGFQSGKAEEKDCVIM